MEDDPIFEQSVKQKKIAFAQSEHVAGVLEILKECSGVQKLVGDSEYETVVNAVTLDAQQQLIRDFIAAVDHIKAGGLHEPT